MTEATMQETERQEKAKRAEAVAARVERNLAELHRAETELRDDFEATARDIARLSALDTDELRAFLKEPWCILPKGREQWWVVVPRWVGLQVGWLERATETYNVFVVNRYAQWLGTIPPELKDKLKLPEPFDATVEGNTLRTSLVKLPASVKQHVNRQTGAGEFQITRGHEFDIMAALIEQGSLPWAPRPVDASDLRQVALRGLLAKPRKYQEAAWREFLKRGALGVFWPWGAGKTVLGCRAVAELKGPKLVVCPTRTLVEQWEKRLSEWLDLSLREGVEVITYNAWHKVKDRDWTLCIFDECHRLPANTFSRLATIRAKYRIGLSASPYREDGRTSYIFALTGYPVGMDWVEFLRSGVIRKPNVEVRIVRGWTEKVRHTEAEVRDAKGRVVVFCDGLGAGAQLAARLKCPHVHGGTEKRLDALAGARVSVVSRVGDEGLSLPDLTKVVEVDFLGGSRRQESQRVGRLFHADGQGEHIVLMTREEFDRFEGRFLALEEKGFKVRVVQA